SPVAPDFGARSAEGMSRPPDAIIDGVEIQIPAVPTLSYFGLNAWGGKTPWTETKYLEAVENRPSNRAVTHHSAFYAQRLPKGGHQICWGPAWTCRPALK